MGLGIPGVLEEGLKGPKGIPLSIFGESRNFGALSQVYTFPGGNFGNLGARFTGESFPRRVVLSVSGKKRS